MTTPRTFALLLTTLLMASPALAQGAPAAQADTAAGSDHAAMEPKVDPEVDRVLRLAEKAGNRVRLFDADFDYIYEQTLIEQTEQRTGRMLYRHPSDLVIEFTDGSGESFRFDGRVYIENRTQQKRRYVHIFRKPSEPPVTLLDVEELPFPQPFGQKRETLIRDYAIQHKGRERLGKWPGSDAPPDDTTEYEHLELIPRPRSRIAREYVRADYWLDPETGLLRQARTENKSEEILLVRFNNVKTNDEVKAADKVFETRPLPEGWDEEVTDHTADQPSP